MAAAARALDKARRVAHPQVAQWLVVREDAPNTRVCPQQHKRAIFEVTSMLHEYSKSLVVPYLTTLIGPHKLWLLSHTIAMECDHDLVALGHRMCRYQRTTVQRAHG